jgi:excisionase family DNA binding protein
MVDEREVWLTIRDIAEQLKVNEETVRRWVRGGELAVLDLGPRAGYRVRPEELARFTEERMGKAEPLAA